MLVLCIVSTVVLAWAVFSVFYVARLMEFRVGKGSMERSVDAEDSFHAHLDECRQCRENCFSLCPVGDSLLVKVVQEIDAPKEFRALCRWEGSRENL